jgi:hypothetical protein
LLIAEYLKRSLFNYSTTHFNEHGVVPEDDSEGYRRNHGVFFGRAVENVNGPTTITNNRYHRTWDPAGTEQEGVPFKRYAVRRKTLE